MTDNPADALQRSLPERYRVERELARGGMSRVYLVRESHPDREVVIKVMDGRLSEEGRERFLREVDFTSRLSHPHIVPIFAAGEADGSLYYVMPYVEGETLADRIEREGSLPIPDAVQIALDVARALHYAHQHGVVHRDVKPGNVLFQDEHALVADFGVARAHGEADRHVTREGHTLGTVEYMAPEQATGAKEIDGRADQYALACMLYEMLAGEPPFHGKTAQSTLARHLSDRAPSLQAVRGSVDDEIEGVVSRALQKTPADRFQSMEEFADALGDAFAQTSQRMSRPTTGGHRPLRGRGAGPWIKLGVPAALLLVVGLLVGSWASRANEDVPTDVRFIKVAVLPPLGSSVGATDGTDPAGLTEALANEITMVLARVPWVLPTPFYTVKALQGANLTVPEMLDRLGVDHLLQGTLMIQGNQVVIQISHVDEGDRQEEGRRFDVLLENWLDEQPRIAREVAQDFVTQFGGDRAEELAALPAQSPAQLDYLRGDRFLGRRTADGLRRAIQSYWAALERDSTYAPAFAKLSSAYALALTYRYEVGLDEYTMAGLAEALGTRAIDLTPDLAAGWAARGYLRALAGASTVSAEVDINRASRIAPNDPSVGSWSARISSLRGNPDQALREAIGAAELDPLASGRQFAVGYQAFHMGRHEVAVQYSEIALSLEPDLMLPRVVKARALLLLGRPEECLLMELGPHAGTRALCLWETGDREGARRIVDSLVTSFGSEVAGDFTPITVAEDLAVFYAYTGDSDASLGWIETAYERSPVGIELRVLESDLFEGVRSRSGFQSTVNRLRGELWDRVMTSWEGPLVRPGGDR